MRFAIRYTAQAAVLSLACSSFTVDRPSEETEAPVCVDGAYVGPKAGQQLASGSREDECVRSMGGDVTTAILTAITKNSCEWRIALASGETLDEGECHDATAHERREGGAFGLRSYGPVSLTSEARFGLFLLLDKSWCEHQHGFMLNDTDQASAFDSFTLTVDYIGPTEDASGADIDYSLFSCVLTKSSNSETLKEQGTNKVYLEVDRVAPVCWHRDSYYYELHGNASFECVGHLAGNPAPVTAQIDVSF